MTQILEESGLALQRSPEIGPPHTLNADRVVRATWLLLWGLGTWPRGTLGCPREFTKKKTHQSTKTIHFPWREKLINLGSLGFPSPFSTTSILFFFLRASAANDCHQLQLAPRGSETDGAMVRVHQKCVLSFVPTAQHTHFRPDIDSTLEVSACIWAARSPGTSRPETCWLRLLSARHR